MRLVALALVAPILMGALQQCDRTTPITRVQVKLLCPKLIAYSDTAIEDWERELVALEKSAPTIYRLAEDYVITRDSIRECLKEAARFKR